MNRNLFLKYTKKHVNKIQLEFNTKVDITSQTGCYFGLHGYLWYSFLHHIPFPLGKMKTNKICGTCVHSKKSMQLLPKRSIECDDFIWQT